LNLTAKTRRTQRYYYFFFFFVLFVNFVVINSVHPELETFLFAFLRPEAAQMYDHLGRFL